MSETLTMVNHIETEKIRTHHAKIVVECTTGKPYYSIEWFDTAKQEYYLGYSSDCIDNVLGWLKESFEIVEAPKTNADRIRAMTDEELARKLVNTSYRYDWKQDEDYWYFPNGTTKTNYKPKATEAWLEWLKHPAEQKSYKKI